jgi:hypothetical protein
MTDTIGTTTDLEHQIGPTGRFSLQVPAGSVAIRGTDGDVVRVRDLDGRSLGDRFTIVSGPDHVSLEPKSRFGFVFQLGSKSTDDDLEVEVPRSASVVIETASADVEATGLAGPKRFKTASGDMTLVDVAGEVDVNAVSGDITVTASDRLDARVRTISGDLSLRAPSVSRLEAGTTSGDLRLDAELSGGGPFSVKTISGDMTIVSRGAFSVEAQTITGDLVTALEHRMSSAPGRKTLVIGRDGPTLQFKSVSGDLLIVEPRDAAPEPPASRRSTAQAATSPTATPGDPAARPGGDAATDEHAFAATESPAASWDAVPTPEPMAEPADVATARLDILRALERGDLSVEAATERLADLDVPVR